MPVSFSIYNIILKAEQWNHNAVVVLQIQVSTSLKSFKIPLKY